MGKSAQICWKRQLSSLQWPTWNCLHTPLLELFAAFQAAVAAAAAVAHLSLLLLLLLLNHLLLLLTLLPRLPPPPPPPTAAVEGRLFFGGGAAVSGADVGATLRLPVLGRGTVASSTSSWHSDPSVHLYVPAPSSMRQLMGLICS
jgi:hypothetical protein